RRSSCARSDGQASEGQALPRRSVGPLVPAGGADPRADGARSHESRDRARAGPGREDRQELRFKRSDETGRRPARRGRSVLDAAYGAARLEPNRPLESLDRLACVLAPLDRLLANGRVAAPRAAFLRREVVIAVGAEHIEFRRQQWALEPATGAGAFPA